MLLCLISQVGTKLSKQHTTSIFNVAKTKQHTTHCQHADATVQACTTITMFIHNILAAFTAGNPTAKWSSSSWVHNTSSTLISLPSLPSTETVTPVSLHTDGTVSPKSMLFCKPTHTSQSQLCSHYIQ